MSLLLKNVKVLGGSQNLPESSDIYIRGEMISAIGSFPHKETAQMIDGRGLYAAPGFIDMHAESDHYLSLWHYPSQEDFLRQGVTTILGGHGGVSLAPLLYGELKSLREWVASPRLNINWHSVREFLSTLSKRPLGVNFATLAGHTSIRRALTRDLPRELANGELIVFEKLLNRSLGEGAYGASLDLRSVYAKQIPWGELKLCGQVSRKHNGFLSLSPRTKQTQADGLKEIIKLGRETGVKILVNDIFPRKHDEDFEQLLALIEDASHPEPMHFTTGPTTAAVLPLYTFLPNWLQTASFEEMHERLLDEWLAPRVIRDLPEIDAGRFRVLKASSHDSLVGHTLRELSTEYGAKSHKEMLIRLMHLTKLKAWIAYDCIDDKKIANLLAHPRSLVSSFSASFDDFGRERILKTEAAERGFPIFLEKMLAEKKLALAEAIRKITLTPARYLGLKKRGELVEGNYADLVGFALEGNRPEIRFVIINGKVAVRDGEYTGALAGRPLHHAG